MITDDQRRPPKYLDQDQLRRLLVAAREVSARDYAALLLAYRFGMRVHEVAGIVLDQIDLDAGRIHVIRGKGSISQWYRLSRDCRAALATWLKERDHRGSAVFPGRGSKHISTRTLQTAFRDSARRAGIELGAGVNMHSLKHSCAVHMLDAGRPTVEVQNWLGHRSIKSTEVYAVISDARRDRTAAELEGNPHIVALDG